MQVGLLVLRTMHGLWNLAVLKCELCIFRNRGDPLGFVQIGTLNTRIEAERWQRDTFTPGEFIPILFSSHWHVFSENRDGG